MRDTPNGYGWISIALHWLTGVIVVALLLIGSSIASVEGGDYREMVTLHTSIAVSSYALLWLRVVWRFVQGHPGPLPGQGRVSFAIGKWVHMLTLGALGALLVSGPWMVWAGGNGISVFDWFTIPSPMEPHYGLRRVLHSVHAGAAALVAIGIVLHLLGVYKHTAFNQDGTFAKMLAPAKSVEGKSTEVVNSN